MNVGAFCECVCVCPKKDGLEPNTQYHFNSSIWSSVYSRNCLDLIIMWARCKTIGRISWGKSKQSGQPNHIQEPSISIFQDKQPSTRVYLRYSQGRCRAQAQTKVSLWPIYVYRPWCSIALTHSGNGANASDLLYETAVHYHHDWGCWHRTWIYRRLRRHM